MKNIKKYFKKIIEILSLKELRILPAYLAYSFVLASIPLFTIIVIVAGRFNISIDTVINLVNDVLPGYVSTTITNVISGKNYDLSIGFLNLITFFLAIKGTYSIINASNNLYKIDKTSPVKDILKSVLILCIIIGILLFLIIVPILGDKILELFRNYNLFKDIIDNLVLIYRAIRWPLTFLMIFFSVKLIYVLAPSVKVKGSDTTIGAFITTIGWILFTLIFGYYIKYFSKYDIIYGGLSSITVLLIWIYALCFILVLGIVINTLKYNKYFCYNMYGYIK